MIYLSSEYLLELIWIDGVDEFWIFKFLSSISKIFFLGLPGFLFFIS